MHGINSIKFIIDHLHIKHYSRVNISSGEIKLRVMNSNP